MGLSFSALLEKYLSDTSTAGEDQQLFELIRQGSYEKELAGLIDQDARLRSFVTDHDPVIGISTYSKIEAEIRNRQSRPQGRVYFFRKAWLRYAAAAVIIMAGVGAWWWNAGTTSTEASSIVHRRAPAQDDILPGSNRAILTLSSGEQIVLSEGSEILNDAGVLIKKTDGELSYSTSSIVAYNTMATPRGGQYRLTLPDGTRVWLNAASSITYPTAFTGNQRKVSVTGEAYFEVTPDPSRPFIVAAPDEEIAVLGTHFNINAYSDEPAPVITLLEGSIRINNDILQPGYAYRKGAITQANMEQAVAWKNGVFNFHRLPLENVMRQLSRWYDITVEYPQSVPGITVGGKMGRDLTLSQVLEVLSEMQVHYKLDGKTIIVLP